MMNTQCAHFMDVSSLCSFCKAMPETHTHIFWDCLSVQPTIQKLIKLLVEYFGCEENIFVRDAFIFSYFNRRPIVYIVTLFKRYIVSQRITACKSSLICKLSFRGFIQYLCKYINHGKAGATYANQLFEFNQLWELFAHDEIIQEILQLT